MHLHPKETDRLPGTLRIEAFSDAVFGIIATLLILDVKVPHLADASTQTVLAAMQEVLPELTTFAFSFITLCIFWVNHHHFYRQLTHADWPLLWHNCHLLFWLTIVPFTTSFLGAYPQVPLVISLYAFVMMMGALAFHTMSRHALLHAPLAHEAITKKSREKSQRRSLIGVFAYGASVLLAPVSIWIAWALLIFVPLFYFVPQLMTRGEWLEEA